MFKIDYPFKHQILACGAQHQAGFCLTKKNCGYVINDLGSLDDQAALERYQSEIERATTELKIKPKIVTHDLHPEYSSTKYAQSLSQKDKTLKCLAIQHHHAHLASCIGENGIKDRVIGVVFDGAGLGEDGQIWGGEFFVGDLKGFKRTAHLKHGQSSPSLAGLFDAVLVLIGLREKISFEGQGIGELERIINRSSHVAAKSYEFTLEQDKDKLLICPEPIFQNILEDLKHNISKSIISTAFHNTIVEIVRQLCHKVKQKEKLKDVILTGSCFKNKFLFNQLNDLLSEDGFKIITHKHFPCNDSNISFGQAVLADMR